MNLVYYSQEDKRWANQPYTITGDKSQTIGTSACGPTCFAMVVSSLTGKTVLPPEASKFAVDKRFRTINSGTAWGYFAAAAKEYGVKCKQVGTLAAAKEALRRGALVIASMGRGEFTGAGHYILLVGIREGKGEAWIDVYDPNHDNRKYGSGIDHGPVRDDGKVSAKESVFIREARQYWIFEAEEEEIDMEIIKQLEERIAGLEKRLERMPAPEWFVKEFGSADLGGQIHDPMFTTGEWRTIAITLRATRYKTEKK